MSEIVRQLMDRPEFTRIFTDLEKMYFEEWVNSDSSDVRERLHTKVEILREVEGELKSLASN